MTLVRIFLMTTLGVLLFAGCRGIEKEPSPDNLLPDSVYVDVLVELQHVRTWSRAQPDSVNVDSLKQLVFDKYEVEEATFTTSHRYYQRNVDAQIQRVEQAISRLEEDEKRIQAHIDSMRTIYRSEGDSLAPQDSMAIADSLIRRDSLGN